MFWNCSDRVLVLRRSTMQIVDASRNPRIWSTTSVDLVNLGSLSYLHLVICLRNFTYHAVLRRITVSARTLLLFYDHLRHLLQGKALLCYVRLLRISYLLPAEVTLLSFRY